MNDSRYTRWYALFAVLVVAVTIAGCNGFSQSGNDGPAPEPGFGETITPAPVPTDTPTPTPAPGDVPGLSTRGITNGNVLLDAHAISLQNRSFTVHSATWFQLENGTILNRTRTTARFGSAGRIYLRTVRGAGWNLNRRSLLARRELWIGNQSFRAAIYTNGTVRYARWQNDANIKRMVIRNDLDVLTRLDTRSTRVLRRVRSSGTTSYLIGGRTDWLNDTNATHRILVGSNGRIDTLRTALPAIGRKNVSRTVFEVRFTDVGTTDVERPPWYEAAVRNASDSARSCALGCP